MYVFDGGIFDIYQAHVINDIQYPPGWFEDAEQRQLMGIGVVSNPTPPEVTATQKAVAPSFTLNPNGTWTANWVIIPKTAEEIAAENITLQSARAAKNEQINDWRKAANQDKFTHAGKDYSCDPLSRSDIDGVALTIALTGDFPEEFPGVWKAVDNTYTPMSDVMDFKALYGSMAKQGALNFIKSEQLKATLAAATTIGEIDAIVW